MRVDIINEKDGSVSLLIYWPKFIKNCGKYERLLGDMNFRRGYVDGREICRQQLWFCDPQMKIADTWKTEHDRWKPNEYPVWIKKLQQKVQKKLDENLKDIFTTYKKSTKDFKFNNVLVNKYRDGQDFIPAHKDNETIFGNNPTIVSLSFGDTRTFSLNRVKYNPSYPRKMPLDHRQKYLNRKFTLRSGDLLIMAGSVQKYFSHEILKSDSKLPRYNLTFREKALV